MLRNRFDPTLPLRYVRYGRMSDDSQNPRSPDQQFAEIDRVLGQTRYPWAPLGDYRDDGISGRLVRGRPGLQRMLNEIKSGIVAPDLILVDTIERFCRADDLPELRRRLHNRHGVLVLTADSRFADPTSAAGRALSFVETIRSTEDGRVKAHNVLRGKRDAIRLGHWPGGDPSLGFKLKNVLGEQDGREAVLYSVVIPDPASAWIAQAIYLKALKTGWGAPRLTRYFNVLSDVPNELKPLQQSRIARLLDSYLYHGELVWGVFASGIVDDREIRERNREEEIIRVPDFCEAIVPKEVSLAVKRLRRQRGEHIRAARAARSESQQDGKQIQPRVRGLALKYLLSGLVRCGHCGRAMAASASPEFTTKSGEVRRYVSYACPGYCSRVCPNGRRIPERWLREQVINTLCHRLFPGFNCPR